MTNRAFALLLALGLHGHAEPVAAADGQVDLGWNACGPITSGLPSIAPGTPEVSLWVSVLGLDQRIRGYSFQILYGIPTERRVPDAWRFDALGCQTAAQVHIDHLVTKTCPPLIGPKPWSLQIERVEPNGTWMPWFESDLMLITLSNAYENAGEDSPAGIDPGTRYFLGRVRFDHTYSVNGPTTPGVDCGGLDEPLCFTLVTGQYVNFEGSTIPFGFSGVRSLTVGPPSGCPDTPTRNSTWGQIKSQYRM
jgi:hypothetical protein